MNLVDTLPPTHLGSSLWHIGWSGVDGQSELTGASMSMKE
jgi:hypothetical protein